MNPIKRLLWIISVCLFLCVLASISQAAGPPDRPRFKAVILYDMDHHRILHQEHADRAVAPASLTKLMSLYVIYALLESGQLTVSDPVRVSHVDVGTPGSKMLFEANAKIPLEMLIKGMAVYSANDASLAAARHAASSEINFVRKMNETAKHLGMRKTIFVNPHGLPNRRQVTTASDMLALSLAYMERFPNALSTHALDSIQFEGMMLPNRNHLINFYPGADGLKTGYVHAAGYHLIVTAVRDGRRLLVIILGAPTSDIRFEEGIRMLDDGFHRIGVHTPEPMIGA